MAPSAWQLILVLVLAILLFGGRGRLSSIMGDLAKGITSFRKGLKDEDAENTAPAEPVATLKAEDAEPQVDPMGAAKPAEPAPEAEKGR